MKKHTKHSLIIILVLFLALSMAACIDTQAKASSGPSNDEGELTFVATFDTNGGTAVNTYSTIIISQSPTTTFAGYVFAGWFLTADFSTAPVSFPYHLSKDTTFYAKWVVDGVKEIYTADDLMSINNAMSSSYVLMQNINLDGIDWMPLGLSLKTSEKANKVALSSAIIPFTGTLDGNGYTIYNLTMEPKGMEQEYNYLPYGLFSIIADNARLTNINLSTYRITLDGGFSDFFIGSLVGQMKSGFVGNCHANGRINNPKLEYDKTIWDDFLGSYSQKPTSNTFIGGLIGGILSGEISGCSSEGVIVSKSVADGMFIGGLSGFNWDGIVSRSRSSMTIEGRYAGNLVGYNNGRIYDSYTTGISSGSLVYPSIAGGISAYNDINGTIERCYAIGAVSARTAGGLVGVNMFNYSKNSPINIAGDPILQAIGKDGDKISIGNGGIIRNCYTTSNVTAAEYGGGLIGRAEAIMPVKGKQDIKPVVTNDFYFISHNFAFGDVKVVVEEVAYENQDGNIVINTGVYHTVYAGGLIGHATEVRMASCLAFGDVNAESKRPIMAGDEFLFNTAYADNAIGHSSSIIKYGTGSYYDIACRDIYGAVDQIVKRNGETYQNFNSAVALPYAGNNDQNVNSVAFLTGRQGFTGLGFSTLYWDFNNLKIEEGRLPRLR